MSPSRAFLMEEVLLIYLQKHFIFFWQRMPGGDGELLPPLGTATASTVGEKSSRRWKGHRVRERFSFQPAKGKEH